MTTDAFDEAGLTQRLLNFDREARLLLYGKKPSVSVVILGGSAFILSGLDARITYDIDVLTVPSALIEILHKYDMNTEAQASMLSKKNYGEMVQAYNNYKKEFYNARAVIS